MIWIQTVFWKKFRRFNQEVGFYHWIKMEMEKLIVEMNFLGQNQVMDLVIFPDMTKMEMVGLMKRILFLKN